MYKSRLQELCHLRLWALPEYTSTREGPDHNPRFRATVTVNGVSFHADDLSKTSKEAQNKAAQAAVEHFALAGPSLPPPRPSPSDKLDSAAADSMKSLPDNQKTCSASGFMEIDDSLNNQSAISVHKLEDPEIAVMKAATDTEFLKGEGTCSLLCNRIRVYPRKPDLVLPEGATLLPFSDDMWVAFSLGFSLLCNRIRVYPRKPDLVLPEGATLLPFSDDMWVAFSLGFSNQEVGVVV